MANNVAGSGNEPDSIRSMDKSFSAVVAAVDQVGPRLERLRSEPGLTLTDVAADSAHPTS
jgi:hypothetical protein